MKKSLMAVALLGAFAGVAHAQTAVQIYGNLDAGFVKRTDQTLAIGKRAANTLGFKGTEDLGNGLKALFQLEIRYEPDTGTVENNSRPLFQGQSRVGLQGDFGMVRLGRGLTPFQEVVGSFEPFHGLPTPAGFYTDLSVAGFTSAPLDPAGSGNNRISNAVFYNSPVVSGFQLNASWATKEANGGVAINPGNVVNGTTNFGGAQYAANSQGSVNPFSIAGTYNNGPVAAMLAYERNAVETKIISAATSYAVTPELKLMLTASRQDQGHINVLHSKTKAWVLGATYALGPGKLLAGYGQKDPDNSVKTKQLSVGYEYNLSKRTYLYVDAARKKDSTNGFGVATSPGTVNHYDVGVNHSF